MPFKALEKYLPQGTTGYIEKITRGHGVLIRITAPRASRLGSFSARTRSGYQAINISGSLNRYSFLITLIHEIAHMKVWEKYGKKVQGHGNEWKDTYRLLISPLINENVFPEDIRGGLIRYFNGNTRSDAAEFDLSRILKKYDSGTNGKMHIEDLPDGSCFYYENTRLFQKIGLARTRYRCKELKTGRLFTFSPLAEIDPADNRN